MKQGYDNNGFLTEDTLKHYNSLYKKLNDLKSSYFNETQIDELKQALKGWQDTYLSTRSFNNSMQNSLYKLMLSFLKNEYQTANTSGSPELTSTVGENIFTLNNKSMYTTKEDTGSYDSFTKYRQDIKIPVPEGWDGNYSFVELLVPYSVVNFFNASRSVSNWTVNSALAHPLLPQADGGYGSAFGETDGANHFTCQLNGFQRKHALLFYSNFVDKNKLKIDVAKGKNYITISTDAGGATGMLAPFASGSLIEPEICARITYYKLGV